MNRHLLAKNLCVSAPDEPPENGRRILWIGDDGFAATISLEGRFAWPSFESTASLLSAINSGELKTYRYSALWGLPPAKDKSLRAIEVAGAFIDGLTELGRPIVDLRKLNEEIHSLAEAQGISTEKADRWVRKWWQNGQRKSGLRPLSGRAGSKKGSARKIVAPVLGRPPRIENPADVRRNLDENDFENFEQGIHVYHRKSDKDAATLERTHGWIREKFYPNSLLPLELRKAGMDCSTPTLAQFLTYYYDTWSSKAARKKAKLTALQYQTRHRKATGSTVHHVLGPCRIYELDSTEVSLHSLDSGRERYVGRAVLYIVIDVATSYIVSWWLSLEHASYLVACVALLGCLENRREFSERIGIDYDPRFPEYFGLCDVLRVDNEEFITDAGKRLAELGIQTSFARVRRGDDKPHVESHIGLAEKIVEFLPGGIKKDPCSGSRDVRRKSFLNIHDLRKIIGRHINALNRRFIRKFPRLPWMIEDKVFPRPYLMWKAGMARFGNSSLSLDYTEAAWSLLPAAKTASANRRALHVQAGRCKDMRYLVPPECNPDLSFDGNGIPVDVRFDPKLVDYVYLRERGTTQIHTCALAPFSSGFRGMTWEEAAIEQLTVDRHAVESSLRDRQDAARDSAEDRRTIEEARAAATKGKHSHTSLVRGTKEARKADTRLVRASEPIIRPTSSAPLVKLHRGYEAISLEDDYAAIQSQL